MSTTNQAGPRPPVPDRDPWPHHPPSERFKTLRGYDESGHTPEQWKAYIRSAVVSDAFDIWAQATDLLDKIEEFGKKYRTPDPGADAILAAGLPLPESVAKERSKVAMVIGDFEGFAWVLNEFCEKVDYYCLDPDDWDENGLFIAPKPNAMNGTAAA